MQASILDKPERRLTPDEATLYKYIFNLRLSNKPQPPYSEIDLQFNRIDNSSIISQLSSSLVALGLITKITITNCNGKNEFFIEPLTHSTANLIPNDFRVFWQKHIVQVLKNQDILLKTILNKSQDSRKVKFSHTATVYANFRLSHAGFFADGHINPQAL